MKSVMSPRSAIRASTRYGYVVGGRGDPKVLAARTEAAAKEELTELCKKWVSMPLTRKLLAHETVELFAELPDGDWMDVASDCVESVAGGSLEYLKTRKRN